MWLRMWTMPGKRLKCVKHSVSGEVKVVRY